MEITMTDFEEFLEEQLKDPEIRAQWDALQPMDAIAQAMIGAGITKKQLSERTGIAQSDISKLETGGGNPSLKTLQRLAADMGMVLHIEFRPAADTGH